MRDFADEIPGYLHNRAIAEHLERLNLKSGPECLGDNLLLCYEELTRMAVVGAEEMALVQAWVSDVQELQR
jgi:hypothetical protein